MKISIIVAVYNAEDFLKRCLDSIIRQTFSDFEVLLIDDGSTDNSGAICDDYASADSRFRVFHKENGGVGSARQMGLDYACGDYVIHMDSDDWAVPDMLKKLYDFAIGSKADVVICDFYRDRAGKSQISIQKPSGPGASASLRDMYTGFCGPFNKFVKRECILKYGVSFPEGIRFMEDGNFFAQLFSNPVSISYLPEAFYHYDMDINPVSTNNNISLEGYTRQKDGVLQLVTVTSNENLPLLSNSRYVAHCAYRALKLQAHTRQEYRKTYTVLYNSALLCNRNLTIHERLILWCSFHFSYLLAVKVAQYVQKHLRSRN